MVHAFVTSRIDYCNSILYGASAAHIRMIRSLQNVLNAAARTTLSSSMTVSLPQYATFCTGFQFYRG